MSGWAVTRPELWETKISRPATLDERIGDFALADIPTVVSQAPYYPGLKHKT
jgi:hypothetical protein